MDIVWNSYTQTSPNGEYVFVMLSSLSVGAEADSLNETAGRQLRELRAMYSRSGLYRNDGSTAPLWTVDWYGFAEPASDGVHLVRIGTCDTNDDEALSFFRNGKLLRTWTRGELVDFPILLTRTTAFTIWRKDGGFDEGRAEYLLWTEDGNHFRCDLRTGEIVESSRPLLRASVLMGCGLFAAALWFVVRSVRKRSPLAGSGEPE